jgi:hypothetical protein
MFRRAVKKERERITLSFILLDYEMIFVHLSSQERDTSLQVYQNKKQYIYFMYNFFSLVII